MAWSEEEELKKELERETIRQNRFHQKIFNRIRAAIAVEARNKKPISNVLKMKYLIEPDEYFQRVFFKISLASLYRRYRRIRLETLVECISLAQKETNRDELVKKIRDKIIEVGATQREIKHRLADGRIKS